MNRLTSVYLDLVRFAAALVVLLVHARHERFTSGWLLPLRNSGIDAVMVFFVLSGFVIAHCVDTKEKTTRDYAVSRLSRLYSVVLPALILTYLLDALGRAADPSIYRAEWFETPAVGFLANLLFLNQIWFVSIAPSSNGPFWSLSYEFWYYAFFGAMTFTQGRRRWLLLSMTPMIMGPKILLLLPVWLMGVTAYRVCRGTQMSLRAGSILMLGSVAVYIALQIAEMPLRLGWNTARIVGTEVYEHQLGESRSFLYSYVMGALVAVHFVGLNAISAHVQLRRVPLERAIRWLASFTFTLYLTHYPLLNFFAAVMDNDPRSVVDQGLLFVLTLGSVVAIGSLTEHRKSHWKRFVDRLVPGRPPDAR